MYTGLMITVGIDEVGRGCWAGPVVAGAVVLGDPINGLKDSKKLTRRQRETLGAVVHQSALAVGIGWVDAATIDKLGITTAVKRAMQRALAAVQVDYDEIIVDGHFNFLADYPASRALVRADDSVPAVSAASIVAKVARDNFMRELAGTNPGYGFERHVGYGTAYHLQQLRLLGVSDQHRRSYKPVKALLQ